MNPHTCLVKFHFNFVINGNWCSKCYCKHPTIWSTFSFCGWTTLILNSWSLQWNKFANTMLEDLWSVVYRESYTFISPNSHPIVVVVIQWSFHYNELSEACCDLVLLTNGLILQQNLLQTIDLRKLWFMEFWGKVYFYITKSLTHDHLFYINCAS